MLTVHHVTISQSERIVWLCEELNISYKLDIHRRDPIAAPRSFIDLPGNTMETAPFITDGDVTLNESGAIVNFIISKYDEHQRLAPKYGDKNYVNYIHWFHFANSSLYPMILCDMFLTLAQLDEMNQVKGWSRIRLHTALKRIDEHLKENKWFAGDQFTAADLMMVYGLTTQRYWQPIQLGEYENILRFLQDIGNRDAYKRAMNKSDPEMGLLLGAEPPKIALLAAGGLASDVWKKKSLTA
ncbi:glutathione S-transferase-like protein [Dendryphion nanum]|uniref:Glutathione S-transferase-like protein n=1 Tax=Dendryphion nanum TaxID=256645 RepID=A0A9P9DEX7_9PLEO|nr:glutathione S-transferase-like protein [Dendryphion nanum]